MLTLETLVLQQDDFRLTADWQVAAGERVALIGPSGAGKSTLLMALAGFFAPAQGRVLWQGRDLAEIAPGDRPLTILFQDQNLFPHLTLAQNLGLGLSPTLRLSSAQTAQIDTALTRVGLAGMGARKPGQLSGGQQGRAALARALLRARPVLLLDEPFAALGPALKAEMLGLLAAVLAGGLTVPAAAQSVTTVVNTADGAINGST
ncbi:ATP-binding cassette domain-containing protein, partial [Cypionkella sp.]|uniref:thiamine ABC transporter ATP-binding protein n=1 Tax=Cypionkella sp. TaxID=2811411 RepID=UPI002ABC8215